LAAGEEVAVPSHWPLEVLNGLIQAKKRQRISEEGVQSFIANLTSFQIVVDTERGYLHLRTIRDLAERQGLTSYDSAYLELALRLSLPLATLDANLRRAALAERVPLL
jgi:predicted nucleic acid-binding protein